MTLPPIKTFVRCDPQNLKVILIQKVIQAFSIKEEENSVYKFYL